MVVQVGQERRTLVAGDAVLAPAGEEHGVENTGAAPAALLVFMAPSPP